MLYLIELKSASTDLKRKPKITETEDNAFNEEFPGIVDFLHEASTLESKTKEPLEKKFIDLAQRLWDLGIRPLEF